MKTILKSMMVVLGALLSVHASAYEQIGGIYYTLNTSTKTASVTYGTNQYTGSVTIPSSISYYGESYSVTSIGSYAFSNCGNVTSVTIPNSVTNIGKAAFNNCVNLTSVAIPNSVTSIGSTAFYGCSRLKSVHINNLAAWCSINFEYEVGMGPFINSYYHLYLNGEEINDLIIPSNVTEIGDGSFNNCIGLTSVTIHNSVTKIGNGAFDGCSGLTSVTIPNSVTEIGDGAFLYCSMLTSVTISNSIISIGNRTFDGCINLTSVAIPNSVAEIKAYAFRGCIKLTSVTIPNSVTELYYSAFAGCSRLTSVVAETETPPSFVGLDTFSGISSTCVLTVPYGTKDAYIAAGWTENVFKGGIVEMEGPVENESLTLGQQGIRTFSSPYELDFTNSTVKAYIASGFSPSTGDLILTRVYNVPAGEGLLLKGETGDYEVPCAETDMVYSNLLKGVVTATNVSPVDGENTNFILANGSHGIGFYTLSEEGEIGAGKAYLQLPTSSIAAMSRSINMLFDDEEENESTELTEIENVASSANEYFDLQGRPIPASSLKSGIYIIRSANGGKEKKVFIK